MKILVNASNIRKSGALQVTLSFLEEIKKEKNHCYHLIVSKEVESQVSKQSFPLNFSFESISLGQPFTKGFYSRKKLIRSAEHKFKPDCVFSLFAPTYWTPRAPHLAGFAYVWAINPDSLFLKNLPLKKKIKTNIENWIKKKFIRQNAQYHVVETEDVKLRLAKYLRINNENIFVVSNTYNHYFSNLSGEIKSQISIPQKVKNQFSLITISSNFPHKNLKIIKEVSAIIKEKGIFNVFFFLTISDEEYKKTFKEDSNIINLGTVTAKECPSLYSQVNAMILPTMLECFSASYPESMVMGKPIITSDLGFAKSICGNAALYFNPVDARDIADKILLLMKDRNMYSMLVKNGCERAKIFPSATERASLYLRLCEKIARK